MRVLRYNSADGGSDAHLRDSPCPSKQTKPSKPALWHAMSKQSSWPRRRHLRGDTTRLSPSRAGAASHSRFHQLAAYSFSTQAHRPAGHAHDSGFLAHRANRRPCSDYGLKRGRSIVESPSSRSQHGWRSTLECRTACAMRATPVPFAATSLPQQALSGGYIDTLDVQWQRRVPFRCVRARRSLPIAQSPRRKQSFRNGSG